MKHDKDIIKTVKLFEEKKVTGFMFVGPGDDNTSTLTYNGSFEDLSANLSFIMYNHPMLLELFKTSVSIASNRLAGKDIDDNLLSKN